MLVYTMLSDAIMGRSSVFGDSSRIFMLAVDCLSVNLSLVKWSKREHCTL